jgi:hypothetical protein
LTGGPAATENSSTMPFRHLKPDQFTPELLDRMQQAFDRVSEQLKLGPDNPLRSKLAMVLIELATEGERENLMARALTALGQGAANNE